MKIELRLLVKGLGYTVVEFEGTQRFVFENADAFACNLMALNPACGGFDVLLPDGMAYRYSPESCPKLIATNDRAKARLEGIAPSDDFLDGPDKRLDGRIGLHQATMDVLRAGDSALAGGANRVQD